MPVRPPLAQIQAVAPAALPRRFDSLSLRVEDVRPVIRIAHRTGGTLTIPERIIFDHELVLILRGRGEVVERRAEGIVRHPFAPRTLFALPPFAPHAFVARGACEHLAVHFDFAPDVPRMTRIDRRRPYRVRLSRDLALPLVSELAAGEGVSVAFHELVRLWNLDAPAARLGAQARLQAIIAELLGGAQAAANPVDERMAARVRRVLAVIEARAAEPLTLADLARAAELRPSRFSEVFRAWTGHTAKDWLRRVRVERARRLLTDPRLSVAEVAERCGFADQYHFSRVFRRIDGLPPSLWRAAALAGRTASGDG
ncbi:MAG TPA: AraC family transcriptional regulator [Planctomycetota bacterium]|nr:AraC family transcriptional regulator [Planctomycetota bacterium]